MWASVCPPGSPTTASTRSSPSSAYPRPSNLRICPILVPALPFSWEVSPSTLIILLVPGPNSFVAPLLLIFLTYVLCRGAQHGASLNLALTSIKIVVIILVVVVGMMHVNPSNWSPFFPLGKFSHPVRVGVRVKAGLASDLSADLPSSPSQTGITAIFPVTSVVFFSYIGFDAIAAAGEEVKNPTRYVMKRG